MDHAKSRSELKDQILKLLNSSPNGWVSLSTIQRQCKIGYSRANALAVDLALDGHAHSFKPTRGTLHAHPADPDPTGQDEGSHAPDPARPDGAGPGPSSDTSEQGFDRDKNNETTLEAGFSTGQDGTAGQVDGVLPFPSVGDQVSFRCRVARNKWVFSLEGYPEFTEMVTTGTTSTGAISRALSFWRALRLERMTDRQLATERAVLGANQDRSVSGPERAWRLEQLKGEQSRRLHEMACKSHAEDSRRRTVAREFSLTVPGVGTLTNSPGLRFDGGATIQTASARGHKAHEQRTGAIIIDDPYGPAQERAMFRNGYAFGMDHDVDESLYSGEAAAWIEHTGRAMAFFEAGVPGAFPRESDPMTITQGAVGDWRVEAPGRSPYRCSSKRLMPANEVGVKRAALMHWRNERLRKMTDEQLLEEVETATLERGPRPWHDREKFERVVDADAEVIWRLDGADKPLPDGWDDPGVQGAVARQEEAAVPTCSHSDADGTSGGWVCQSCGAHVPDPVGDSPIVAAVSMGPHLWDLDVEAATEEEELFDSPDPTSLEQLTDGWPDLDVALQELREKAAAYDRMQALTDERLGS